MDNKKVYVLDAEFTGNTQEILELAVMNLDAETVFHSYFRPTEARSWRLEPHNITPAMVRHAPTFAECREKLQQLFDSAEAIVGFAVSNDTGHLERHGINFPADLHVIETRELYRLYASEGQEKEMSPFAIPGLGICASAFGIEFADQAGSDAPTEHSAYGDTLVTLRLYRACLDALREKTAGLADASPERIWEYAHEANERARAAHYRRSAHGFLILLSQKPGEYCIQAWSSRPRTEPRGMVACIEVEDRYRALYTFHSKFPRLNPADPTALSYRLKPKHVEMFKSYSEPYDEESAEIYRRLMKPLVS